MVLLRCSFRPWLDVGSAATAQVTFVGPGGSRENVPATKQNGRWVTTRALGPAQSAVVARGDVQDAYGNFNGTQAGPIG